MRWVLWWCAVGLLGYVLILYPLILAAWARRKDRPPPGPLPNPPPTITLLIPAHNEGSRVEAKIRNTLALRYPEEMLRILVACDGCTDDTAARAEQAGDGRVRILAWPDRLGKAGAINRAMEHAVEGDLLAVTDTGSLLPNDALLRMAPHFSDPDTGCVCGRYVGGDDRTAPAAERLYYHLDMALRIREAAIRTTLSGTGGLMVFRPAEFAPFPPHTIHDDFVLPARLALTGARVLVEVEIPVRDQRPVTYRGWYQRRVRLVYGNWQLAVLLPNLLNPRTGFPCWVFLSHKLGRHLAPAALAVCWICSPAVSPVLFTGLTAAAAAMAVVGSVGMAAALRGSPPGPVTLACLYAAAWCHGTAAWIFRRPVRWGENVTAP